MRANSDRSKTASGPGDTELDECVSLPRAGKILGVCARTVRREIDRGKLAAFRVGRSVRIRMGELRRYMEQEPVRA
jgi:excisionase family DNA binding protein